MHSWQSNKFSDWLCGVVGCCEGANIVIFPTYTSSLAQNEAKARATFLDVIYAINLIVRR